MSKLGKILLWVALVGAIVAVGAGVALVFQYNDTKTNLAQVQQGKTASDKAAALAKQQAQDAAQAATDANTKLTAANSSITDLNTQLDAAKKAAADAATAAQTANDNATAAQAKLDAINKTLNGETADQYVADKNKAESDLAAAQAEQKIIQDQLQSTQQQVADLTDAVNRSKTGKMPGVSGKVTFVDNAWNFVILDVGISAGVVPNGELIVYRGRDFLGKVRVTKVDPNDSVAEILPDVKGVIQIGDSVLN
jgi:multidrug efflux pump subunit AcrA (membrane-fusion protein)